MPLSKLKITLLASLLLGGAFSPFAGAAPDLLNQFPVKAAPAAKKRVSQSSVALRGAFPVVAKSALKGALDAKNLALAKKSVGKVALFSGVVTEVYAPKSGAIVLLNFAKDYKTALVGAVKARDFRRFPDLKTLKGKRVALRGKVVIYKGAPEIELVDAGAIRIVK